MQHVLLLLIQKRHERSQNEAWEVSNRSVLLVHMRIANRTTTTLWQAQ